MALGPDTLVCHHTTQEGSQFIQVKILKGLYDLNPGVTAGVKQVLEPPECLIGY